MTLSKSSQGILDSITTCIPYSVVSVYIKD